MTIPILDNYSIKSVDSTLANRPDWHINPNECALLIHDMQQYFINFYGKNSTLADELVDSIVTLKQWAKHYNIPCLYTAQPGNQDPEERALLTDFWGVGLADDPEKIAIISALEPEENDVVFTKWRYSAFKKNTFHQWLTEHNKKQLVICGVYGHIGILATALDAFMLDIQPFVVADAVGDFSQVDHQHTLDFIAKRCGVVTTLANLPSIAEEGFTLEMIRQDVAEVLMIDSCELDIAENLQDCGLDSMRLIALMEKWQTVDKNIGYAEFIIKTTVEHWYQLLTRSLDGTATQTNEGVA